MSLKLDMNWLISLGQNIWAIGDSKVSENELLNLAENGKDMVIREVRAPLSSVSYKALELFIKTHGSNIKLLNIQNNRYVNGENLVSLTEMTPSLNSLSFQYLHEVKNQDLLRIIQTCQNLKSLRICMNRSISKQIFSQILSLNREFKMLSLDLFASPHRIVEKKEAETEVVEDALNADDANKNLIRAQIETLKLSGAAFTDKDLASVVPIRGLRTISLSLTKVTPGAVAQLCTSFPLERPLTLNIKEISIKKIDLFEQVFKENNLRFNRISETEIEIVRP